MNNAQFNNINNELFEATIELLKRLEVEDQYYCIAEIPGPILEMRSGTLPRGCTSSMEFQNDLLEELGLDRQLLQIYEKKIEEKYDFYTLLKNIEELLPEKMQQPFLEDLIAAIERKIRGDAIWSNTATKIRNLKFEVNEKNVEITYPNDLVTIGLFVEIFIENTYDLRKEICSVNEIYDFGANIGLSTLFFYTLNPQCKFKCIEPFVPNLAYLKGNITNNRINAEIIPAAVSDKNHTHVKFYYSNQSHALPSLSTVQECVCEVETISLDKIISGEKYGLKIDIEGSEAYFANYVTEIENAKFIVGELHYSKNQKRNIKVDQFFALIKANFEVVLSKPILYFVGEDVELCICYKAKKKDDK